MKLEFSAAALKDSASFRHLTAIAWHFRDERHRWIVGDPDGLRSSPWLLSEGSNNRRAFAEMADQAARKFDSPDLRVAPVAASEARETTCWVVPADLAERIAREPLVVIVENARCDGAFLQKLALRVGERTLRRSLGNDAFERLRTRWRDPLGDGDRIEVVHGGGNNTAQQLRLYAKKEPSLLRRVFVIVDSDRSTPDAPLGSTAGQVSKVHAELRAEHGPKLLSDLKIFDKREVENYLPEEALRTYRKTAFEGWQRLSDVEKDFEDLKVLFGADLWRVLCEPDFDGHFHERSLRTRAGAEGRELDDLIKRLAKLL